MLLFRRFRFYVVLFFIYCLCFLHLKVTSDEELLEDRSVFLDKIYGGSITVTFIASIFWKRVKSNRLFYVAPRRTSRSREKPQRSSLPHCANSLSHWSCPQWNGTTSSRQLGQDCENPLWKHSFLIPTCFPSFFLSQLYAEFWRSMTYSASSLSLPS